MHLEKAGTVKRTNGQSLAGAGPAPPPVPPSPMPAPGTSLPPVHRRDSHKPGAPVRNSLFPSHLSPHRASPRSQVHLHTPHSLSTHVAESL